MADVNGIYLFNRQILIIVMFSFILFVLGVYFILSKYITTQSVASSVKATNSSSLLSLSINNSSPLSLKQYFSTSLSLINTTSNIYNENMVFNTKSLLGTGGNINNIQGNMSSLNEVKINSQVNSISNTVGFCNLISEEAFIYQVEYFQEAINNLSQNDPNLSKELQTQSNTDTLINSVNANIQILFNNPTKQNSKIYNSDKAINQSIISNITNEYNSIQ